MDLLWTKTAGVDRSPLSWQGHHRQLHFDFWTSGSVLFGWNLTFDTILGKRKHYESRRHFFSTPYMLGQSITNWGHNTLSVPKNELRAGHELRKTLSFMTARSKSYIPNGIFSKARLHIFDRNSIPIVISGDGTSLKILLIPLNSKKVQSDAIYRKMESSKLSQSKKKFEVNKYSKIHKFQPPPSHFPPPTLRTYY